MKHQCPCCRHWRQSAATFGWLCVETKPTSKVAPLCVTQPPSGGCVLKRVAESDNADTLKQPPSGGCVLKRCARCPAIQCCWAATFGWLCVETLPAKHCWRWWAQPPSGGCVLKRQVLELHQRCRSAATFGWLCVETLLTEKENIQFPGSHLRVAVC